METLWFWLVALLLTGYVLLDGFDLGAGVVLLVAAKTEEERRQVLQSIGPVWDGNEVWLLAGGGTLYFAFPALYASSFSGFYLPLILVLWLLMLRGISIELRNHIDSPVWKPLWDAVFGGASALLAVFFGAALGNVVRGVPLDSQGDFFLPLWTHWDIRGEVGVLDWYTVLVGVAAFVTLTAHGSLWVHLKTGGDLQRRAKRLGLLSLTAGGALAVLLTAVTFAIQPLIPARFAAAPWGWIFPVIAVGGWAVAFAGLRRGQELRAFYGSCGWILGLMTSVAFGLFPYVLPSNQNPLQGLTVYNASAAPYGLRVGLIWFVPGMLLACGYTYFVYRRFAGKVTAAETAT